MSEVVVMETGKANDVKIGRGMVLESPDGSTLRVICKSSSDGRVTLDNGRKVVYRSKGVLVRDIGRGRLRVIKSAERDA